MSVLLKPTNYKLYKHFAQMPTTKLAPTLYKLLQKYYSNVITNDTYDYIIAEGDTPIALIAHMDTVFDNPPCAIYYDPVEEVVWSPYGGVGDDRVGIFMIILTILDGYRPTIIFTNDEELGGLGATQLTTDFPNMPWKINFCIELDRHGRKDAAFYNCANEAFTKYITSFDFEVCRGLFTDICIICPDWKIAGVNLSIGYVGEHSQMEYWFVEFAAETYKKLIRILEDGGEQKYDYVPEIRSTIRCDCCLKQKQIIEIFPGIMEDGSNGFICADCIAEKNLQWCVNCGKLFIGKGDLCRRCRMSDRESSSYSWIES